MSRQQSGIGIKHLAIGTWHWHLAFGVRHSAFSNRHLAFGVRHSAFSNHLAKGLTGSASYQGTTSVVPQQPRFVVEPALAGYTSSLWRAKVRSEKQDASTRTTEVVP
jgi:hypothetical protein